MLVIGITALSGYANYISHRNVVINNFVNEHINEIQRSREYYRLKLDKLQHDFLKSEPENLSKLNEFYRLYKKNNGNVDINNVANELNKNTKLGTYQAFTINRNYLIDNASYSKDLGYNLGQHQILVDIFNSIFNKEIDIDVSPIQIDSASMQFKRYLLKLSHDQKHLLQIGFVLNLDELIKGEPEKTAELKTFDLYLSNGNLIQPIALNLTRDEKKSLAYGWEQTKRFLAALSADLQLRDKEKIARLLALDITTERLRINDELESLFSDDRIVHSLDHEKNLLSIYSITNSLFNKGSETKLIIKAQYSTEELARHLKKAKYDFFVPLALSVMALGLIYILLQIYIMRPLLKTIADIQKNRRSQAKGSFISEIELLNNCYNRLHDQLHSEIKTNAELLKLNRRCIADTIHQVKTPLTNIIMSGEIIKKSAQNDKISYYMDRIDSSVSMLSHSYDDLAYVVTSNTLEYSPSRINLSEIISKRIKFFSTISKVVHKEMQYRPTVDQAFVFINRVELERIIDNNLSNAMKYAEPSRPITIRLDKSEGLLTLSFATYGEPIQNRDRIFDEGYRERDGKQGLGLGLSMVKGICNKNALRYSVSYVDGQNIFAYQFPENQKAS